MRSPTSWATPASSVYAEVALVLFLAVFVAVAIARLRAVAPAGARRRPRSMPLDDDATPQ